MLLRMQIKEPIGRCGGSGWEDQWESKSLIRCESLDESPEQKEDRKQVQEPGKQVSEINGLKGVEEIGFGSKEAPGGCWII